MVGIVVNLAAYFLSTAAFRRTIVHYLLPSLIYGIILMTELISEHRLFQYRKTSILVISVIVGLLTLPKMSLIKTAPEFTGFGGVLIEKGLKNGYAAFFSASVNSVHYDSRVTVRPIHSTTVYTVQRFPWLSKDSWYEEPAHFVVIQDPPDFGVTEEAVINTFGEPDQVIAEGNYRILVWEKDIAPLLPDQ